MKKIFWLLGVILLLGIFLRFNKLEVFPVGLHRDEAFLGYNAYSILKTGSDMSGNFLPLHLKSFLYSPAGYSYFSIPSIFLFGLNEFSVRFASAFFGSMTILLVFFLTREIFYKNPNRDNFSLLSSFFLSISPWHINLSRTATENTIVVFFLILGIIFYLEYLRETHKYLFLSFLCFGMTLFLYQAPRAFLPIFIPLMVVIFTDFKKIFKDKFLLGFLYFTVILLPLILVLISPLLSLRISTLSIFHGDYVKLILTQQAANDGQSGVPYIATRLLHNKVIGYSLIFFQNYFKHFSFEFLFTDGGFPDRYRVPFMGILYLYELPLIIYALFSLLKRSARIGLFLLSWIIISPIGSALTSDDIPNLQRTLLSVPAYTILSGYGLFIFLRQIRTFNEKLFKIFLCMTLFVISYFTLYYLVQYYSQQKVYKLWFRQDGYKELVGSVDTLLPHYKNAIITDRESSPTIFFLFYGKYDPAKFQLETKEITNQSIDRVNFAKYMFTQEECPLKVAGSMNNALSAGEKNVLYVDSGLCKDLPVNARLIKEVKRGDSSLVFKILDIK